MLSDIPNVVVLNETTVLNRAQTWNLAWALNYQVRWQFGPAWNLSAQVSYIPVGVPIPAGSLILHLLDTADQEGALGYHDEDGNQLPYGRVFVKTAQANGVTASEVLSHECLELLADPHVNATAYDPSSGRLYPMEVGDPAQGFAYDLGAPYGKATGIIVSDFALPNWFDPNTPAGVATDYRGGLKGAFALGKGGYVSYTKKLPPNWQQQLGENVNPAIVGHDDRVQRRNATTVAS